MSPEPNQNYEPPQPEYRFRWAVFLGVPLVIIFFLFLLNGMEPSFLLTDLMQALNVDQEARYIRLVCLLVVLVTITLIIRLLRKK